MRPGALVLVACLWTPAAWAADEPMLGSAGSLWGDLDLAYRLRLEVRDNGDLDSGRPDTSLMALQRVRIGLDLHHAEWLQVLAELQDSRALGMGNGSVVYSGNADLHQAFLRLTIARLLTLTLGRQMIDLGDQRLVGSLEWSNVGRVFDALRIGVSHGMGSLDVFAAVFTPESGGNLLRGTWFAGIHSTLELRSRAVVWDHYVLGLFDTEGALPQGTVRDPGADAGPGPEREIVTVGTRLALSGRGLASTFEVAYQTGYHFVGHEPGAATVFHDAYALHGDVQYTFQAPLSPAIRIEVNHASGNRDDASRHWSRFDNLFPTNHGHYGALDLASWSAILDASAGLSFSPARDVRIRADYWILLRGSPHDGWFGASGAELAPAPDPLNPTAHDTDLLLGHEVDLLLKAAVNAHLAIQAGMGVFVPRGYALLKGSSVQLWGFVMLSATL